MTIPSENRRNDYIGNGALDTYSYTFKITDESDIKVFQRDTDDVETPLTLNVDYTVTGVGGLNGGSIVLTAGNLTTDYHLTIRRDSNLSQQTDIRNQGDFYPEVHEDTFDHLAAVDQTQQAEIDRSVKVSETYPIDVELPGPLADKIIGWNGAGDALVNIDPGSVALAIPADGSVTPAKIQSGLPFLFPETFVLKKGADVASAAALPLINDGNYVDVAGTDTITSMDTIGLGVWMLLRFDAALTLTHHVTDLFLPNNGSDITTAAGDHALMVEYGVGKWRCAAYIKANGQPISLTNLALINPNIILGGDANGDIYYRDAAVLKRLPKGANGQILQLISGIPSWRDTTNTQNFTSDDTFIVPAGITKAWITATAGGGGGGGGGGYGGSFDVLGGGGGGGGGGRQAVDFDVVGLTPGETVTVTVGAGGAGGAGGSAANGAAGSAGGVTSFGAHLSLTGGTGGGGGVRGDTGNPGDGGAGGANGGGSGSGAGGTGGEGASGTNGGDGIYGDGGAGGASSGGAGGGGGGGTLFGDGGAGADGGGTNNADNSDGHGTGAGGGSGNSGDNGGAGGDGDSGILIVKW